MKKFVFSVLLLTTSQTFAAENRLSAACEATAKNIVASLSVIADAEPYSYEIQVESKDSRTVKIDKVVTSVIADESGSTEEYVVTLHNDRFYGTLQLGSHRMGCIIGQVDLKKIRH